jgi:hypothetical protein
MAYQVISPRLGAQAIAETSTTAKHHLGEVVQAVDPTYGVGEFIYLKGVASTVVGNVVSYNSTTHTTTLAVGGKRLPRSLAVAMSANVANQYGWYQISGIAVVSKKVGTSFASGVAIGINSASSAGFVIASGTGKEIQGCLVAAVASAKSDVTTVLAVINRPRIQGRIT